MKRKKWSKKGEKGRREREKKRVTKHHSYINKQRRIRRKLFTKTTVWMPKGANMNSQR